MILLSQANIFCIQHWCALKKKNWTSNSGDINPNVSFFFLNHRFRAVQTKKRNEFWQNLIILYFFFYGVSSKNCVRIVKENRKFKRMQTRKILQTITLFSRNFFFWSGRVRNKLKNLSTSENKWGRVAIFSFPKRVSAANECMETKI